MATFTEAEGFAGLPEKDQPSNLPQQREEPWQRTLREIHELVKDMRRENEAAITRASQPALVLCAACRYAQRPNPTYTWCDYLKAAVPTLTVNGQPFGCAGGERKE